MSFRVALQTMFLCIFLLAIGSNNAQAQDTAEECANLKSTLRLENTTILASDYISTRTTVSTPGSCGATTTVAFPPLCRVQLIVNTTMTSSVHAEAWLPDTWFGRFLALGNGGNNGCIDYAGLGYGTSLHFASIASDNGHDGSGGLPFLNHPEVINDFAFRAIHVEALIGKALVRAYYGAPPTKSYYLGCSTGGRQGTQAALKFPEDFDGIVAGSPATDWNHLQGWSGMLSHFVGSPNITNNPKFLTPGDWAAVSAEILRQCDALDGVMDGIIAEPDDCQLDADVLLCAQEQTEGCLTATQVKTVKNVFSPLLGENGELLYPRYSPGAEADAGRAAILGGPFFSICADWERYAVLNVTDHDFTNFGLFDVKLMDQVNAGGIRTFDGDLSSFRERGGKFITYHGRRDPLISSTNSKRVYDLVQSTLGDSIDDFYRLFLIPGMGHCGGGVGPTSFGQGTTSNIVNTSSHNVLLAIVDWVENGLAPATIIGSTTNGSAERTFCRYPMQSVWDGTKFVCVQ
ncbi:Carboxylic ester hydrolase [Mycena kentingensis (nom. inval.)]|nr:Carboxylic ester hydrolase [Mycena kentingensis (nom. inval.)]